MMNLPYAGPGAHCLQLSSKPLFEGVKSECRIVQIGLDRHCGGVIRSSDQRWGGVLLSPCSLRDRKGTLYDHAAFGEVVGL